ncbi:ABC transporter substrate-binding protein [Shimwellia pseudoproteus]|uniref:ABC transporter substrate-binding protein n=1 Tax=Shimwellia pseudoproteus TaxID=570012 RepID=UPI0018ED9A30|nr:ABC transporter substrate-binding protein [Shimwellia pseudoproteus]MBJ3813954.1 ABC transporter substrate-binding protein [Shimwellia pseudoproteus]
MVALLFSLTGAAHPADWQTTRQQASGQTVWFNAWGGDSAVNRYLDQVSAEMKRHYNITLNIVHIADAADSVKRIATETASGRRTDGGSVDLLWVNGENFYTLKRQGLLLEGWAQQLPNWRYVNTALPVQEDFTHPTDGSESPWGSAQLLFITRQSSPHPGDSQALLDAARANPGKFSYPRPPDFTGTAFLEQLLSMLTPDPRALRQPPDPATVGQVTAPLWAYLDKLHPLLWRQGKDFPANPGQLDRLFAQGALMMSMTFNPAHARHLVLSKQLPADSQTFGFRGGMIGNVHFVAIPANARAKAAAQVVANYLLSPPAQAAKTDPAVWGDPSVLDAQKVPAPWGERLARHQPEEPVAVLGEPNAAWVPLLEQAWLHRYGTR